MAQTTVLREQEAGSRKAWKRRAVIVLPQHCKLPAMSSKTFKVSTEEGKPIEISDPFARRLVGKYLGNRQEDIGKLTRALADRDFDTIRITGHNLYGSGATYGLDDISYLGASIENAAVAMDPVRIQQLIGELKDFLSKMKVL